MNVSVLLLTYNEEQNLLHCLNALTWCDDILVMDSGSTDATVAIARSFGARIMERTFDSFSAQRNFALDNGSLRHDWVLHLDADEIVTDEFEAALHALTPARGIVAYRVASKTIFRGRWLRHAGMYPSYQVRLGHREGLRFKQIGHGQREDLSPDQLATFPVPYLHYSFSHGMKHWLDRHVRYAVDEARQLLQERKLPWPRLRDICGRDAMKRRRALKALAARLPVALRPSFRFLYVYFVRRGFLDGRAGFVYAFMLAIYEGMIAIAFYGETRPPDVPE